MKKLTKTIWLATITALLVGSNLLAGLASAAGGGSATLSLSPATGSVQQGNNLTVGVYEDSGSDSVNAVQANLSYSTSQLTFISVDGSNSAFGIAAEGSGGGGSVRIGRGSTTAVTNKQLVASVTFSAAAGSGTASITFAGGSSVVRSSDNGAETLTTVPGNYTLTTPPAPPSSPPPTNPPPTGGSTKPPSSGSTKKSTSNTTPSPSGTPTPAPSGGSPAPAAASTPDLSLSNVKATDISASKATISWSSSIAASSEVDYGSKANSYTHSAADAALVTKHSLVISTAFLKAGQPLHFSVKSTDALGRSAVSSDGNFKVPAKPGSPSNFWLALVVVVAIGVVAIAAAEFIRRMHRHHAVMDGHYPLGHDHSGGPAAPPATTTSASTVVHPTGRQGPPTA